MTISKEGRKVHDRSRVSHKRIVRIGTGPVPRSPPSAETVSMTDPKSARSRFSRCGPARRFPSPSCSEHGRRPVSILTTCELHEELLSLIEDLEIAAQLRERAAEGEPVSLADVATELGLDPDDFR